MAKKFKDEYEEEYNGDELYNDELYEDELYDDAYLDELPPEERKLRRAGRFKVAAGLFDFSAVIIGLIVALALIALIVSLASWVINDLSRTFNFVLN